MTQNELKPILDRMRAAEQAERDCMAELHSEGLLAGGFSYTNDYCRRVVAVCRKHGIKLPSGLEKKYGK